MSKLLTLPIARKQNKRSAEREQFVLNQLAELHLRFGDLAITLNQDKRDAIFSRSETGKKLQAKLFPQTYQGNNLNGQLSRYKIALDKFTVEQLESFNGYVESHLNGVVECPEYPTEFDLQVPVTIQRVKVEALLIGQTDKHITYQLKRILAAIDTHGETLIVPYRSTKSGRYTMTWPVNMQSMTSEMRDKLLSGLGIDMEAAVVQCTIWYAKTLFNEEPEVLIHYLNNKNKIRNELAEKYGVTVDQIKKTITSLCYGAQGSPAQVFANYKGSNAIVGLLGDSFIADKVMSDEVMNSFRLQLKEYTSRIVRALAVKTESGWECTNAAGKLRIWNKKSAKAHIPMGKIMAHIYFGWESKRMLEILDKVKDGLLMHDGVVGSSANEAPKIDVQLSVDVI